MVFGPFSGDKGDYIDVWIINITTKTDQLDILEIGSRHQNEACGNR